MITTELIKNIVKDNFSIPVNFDQYHQSFYKEFEDMIEDWQKFIDNINNRSSNFLTIQSMINSGNLTEIGIFKLLDFINKKNILSYKFMDENTFQFLLIRECLYSFDSMREYNETGQYTQKLPPYTLSIDFNKLADLYNIVIDNVEFDGITYGIIYDQKLIEKL